jgi:hypothetical protein
MRLFTLILAFSISLDAAAYLDPGTGSMILQGLIAGIAVAWFTIKTYWYKFAGFFGKKKPDSILDDEPALDLDESQK